MAPRKRLDQPGVQQTFERVPDQEAPEAVVLETLHIAPWYHVQRAFEGTQPLADALVTFEGEDGAEDVSSYDSGYYDADPAYAQLPGNPRGGLVDTDWSDLYAVVNGGTSAQKEYALNSPDNEVVLLDRTGTAAPANIVLSDSGSYVGSDGLGERTVQFPGVDFTILLAGYTLPGPSADPGPGPSVTTAKPNYLADDYFYVEFVGSEDRFARVIGIHPSATDTLIVRDDINVPSSGGIKGRLIFNPRHFDWITDNSGVPVARSAQRPLRGWTVDANVGPIGVGWDLAASNIGQVCQLDSTDECVFVNLDTINSARVDFVSPGADAPLSVALTYDSPTSLMVIEITLGWTGGGGGAIDPTLNTIPLINAAIREAARDFSLIGECPWQFTAGNGVLGGTSGGFDRADCAQGAPTVFNQTTTGPALKADDDWNGAIEVVTAGDEGNGIQFSIQQGADATPSVERIGDHFILSLGTVPTNNTVAAINADLAVDGVLTITGSSTPATDLVDIFSLGTARNHAGYAANVWDINDQSGYLHGGVDVGAVEVFGSLVSHFDESDPNLITVPIYAEYRSLRVDLSSGASVTATGNRPRVTKMRRSDYKDIVGEISVANPMGLVAEEYFQASGGRPAYFLGVKEVSEQYPWGTEDAVSSALSFTSKRDVYHIYIYNDAN